MTRFYASLVLLILLSGLCSAQDILISDGGTVFTCSGTIYDSGGPIGDYSNDEVDTLTVCGLNNEDCLTLDFIEFEIETGFDDLYVYAGPDASGELIASLTGDIEPGVISPGVNCVTLVFVSDFTVTDPGFEIEVSCACPTCDDGIQNGQELSIDCGGPDCPACAFSVISEEMTLTTCEARLLDSGVFGEYGNNEDYTMTFCPEVVGSCLELVFDDLDIQFNDHLYIYSGNSSDGILLADLTSTTFQTPIVVPEGCVTFNFVSSGVATADGFDISISCTEQCPTCDDGILNGYELAVDCGGPDCPECEFVVMDGIQTLVTCSTTVYDNGYLNDYSENAYDVLSICSDVQGACLQAEFFEFDIEGEPYDTFTIYAGEDINAPLFGTYGDSDPPQIVNPGTECLTFEFISDGSVEREGYEIGISCVCPTCDDGILNGFEVGIDCGGPDCEDCDFNVISEGGTVVSCDAVLYDTGIEGDYGNDEDHTMTFCSDGTSSCLELIFNEIEIEEFDHLYVYDGDDTDGFLIADITDVTSHPPILTPSDCVTFHFESSAVNTGAGFNINIVCAEVCPTCDDGILNGYEIGPDCGGPDCEECPFVIMDGVISGTTCDALVYDNGFNGNYADNSNDVLTLCSTTPGECIQLDFQAFDVENNFDFLTIYAGPNTDSPEIGTYTGTDSPGLVEPGTECVTVVFTSDGTQSRPGFLFSAICQCPSCEDGILNGQELAIDCGGPHCPACDFNAINEEGTLTDCYMEVYDSGLGGDYSENEDYTMTLCNPFVGDSLFLEFDQVQIGIGDHLYIYEGIGTVGELLADITAAVTWSPFFSSTECVTLNFTSNQTGNSGGFYLQAHCADSILTSLDEQNFEEASIVGPTDGRIYINHPSAHRYKVDIFDALGNLVYSDRLNSGDWTERLALKSGVYFLIVDFGEGNRQAHKFLFDE